MTGRVLKARPVIFYPGRGKRKFSPTASMIFPPRAYITVYRLEEIRKREKRDKKDEKSTKDSKKIGKYFGMIGWSHG